MREQGLFAKTVCINVRDKGLFSFTRQTKLEEYTDITRTIQQEAMELFVKNYSWKQPIRSIGVSLCNLVPNTIDRQISMIDNSGLDIRQEKLDKTIDRLKQRFGAYSVRNGNLLKDPELSNFNPKEEHTIHPVGYF
jgi:DNA polymerase-4